MYKTIKLENTVDGRIREVQMQNLLYYKHDFILSGLCRVLRGGDNNKWADVLLV